MRGREQKITLFWYFVTCEKSGNEHFLTFFVLPIKIIVFLTNKWNKKKGRLEE